MCEFASSIVTRDYQVIWFPGIDSHAEILALAKIDDTQSEFKRRNWAKIELRPPDRDRSISVDRWQLVIDEVTRPEWFDSEHKRAIRSAVEKRLKVESEVWVCEHLNGTIEWFFGQKHHRDNRPAIEWSNGGKEWYRNGKLHRDDGPAIEFINKDKEWWRDGKLHRNNGPAIERHNGSKEWWHNGKKIM